MAILPENIKQISLMERAKTLLQVAPTLAEKLKLHGDLGEHQPLDGLVEVLRFMALTGDGKMLTPSIRVDKSWHQFILHTQLYIEYCTKCYDKYLHHTPSNASLENQQQFNHCIELYQQQFGQPCKWFWGTVWQVAVNGDCSACETS